MSWPYLFQVETPLGFRVRTTPGYWLFLVEEKHPVLAGAEADIIRVLSDPDRIRRSRKDSAVYLFYRQSDRRWLCAGARRGDDGGFLITAYPTNNVKAGEVVWTRSR